MPNCPYAADALFLRGEACSSLIRLQEALSCYTAAIERWNEAKVYSSIPVSRLYAVRGSAFLRNHEFENAIFDLTEAIRHDDYSIRKGACLFASRGLGFLKLHRYDDALLDFSVAIQRHPCCVNYKVRATCLSKLGRFDEALLDFDAALRLDPEDGEVLRRRAEMLAIRSAQENSRSIDGRSFFESILARYRQRRNQGKSSEDCWGGLFARHYSPNSQLSMLLNGIEAAVIILQATPDFPSAYATPLIAYLRQQVDAIVHLWCRCVDVQADEPNFAVLALRYSDQMKGLGQVMSLNEQLRHRKSLFDFGQLDVPEEGIVVAYHIIRNCELCSDCVVRWVYQEGTIVHLDCVDVNAIFAGPSLTDGLDLFASLLETQSGDALFSQSSIDVQMAICQQLFSLLLEELGEFLLPKSRHVTFVPDRILFRVPFGCLVDSVSGTFFIEERSFSVSTSLRMLRLNAEQMEQSMMHRLTDSSRMRVCGLFAGNPWSPNETDTLQEAIQERKTVVKDLSLLKRPSEAVGCISLVRERFSSNGLEQCLRLLMPRIVHVATHSSPLLADCESVDPFPEYAMTGGILCSDDLYLYATRICEFDMCGTQLVFLNSCGLADGSVHEVGMMGFYRACFLAGCPSVICSLWHVYDALSRLVASKFYKVWREGSDKAESLRTSVLSLMRRPIGGVSSAGRIREVPALWGAFQLFGNRL